MFAFKKIVTAFILPPGAMIFLLLIVGLGLLWTKKRKAGLINLLLGLLLWLVSIEPVSNALTKGLEAGLEIPARISGDVIIVLGGGTFVEALDMTGKGFPGGDMLARLITAVRLQQRLNVPVLVTCGNVFPGTMAGAGVAERLLIDLGVPEDRIVLEDKSRDTEENARFSIAICRQRGWVDPILLTSSIHIKRGMLLFERYGLKTKPFPACLITAGQEPYRWNDFLPHGYILSDTAAALHEYLGILYYRLLGVFDFG